MTLGKCANNLVEAMEEIKKLPTFTNTTLFLKMMWLEQSITDCISAIEYPSESYARYPVR